jgi:hypothetical protein
MPYSKHNIPSFTSVILNAVSLPAKLKSFMMKQLFVRCCFLALFLVAGTIKEHGQTDLPPVFRQGTISEQLKYLNERARIYEDYRAIREDMFRSISRNTLDTLTKAKKRITGLVANTYALNNRIDSLNKSLESTRIELNEKTHTKNSIPVLGMEVNKTTYNTMMWTILAALVFLLTVGYLSFKQNRVVTLKTKKELDELSAAFEDYRTKTRLEREKTAIEHFKEIQKLKGH